MSTDRVAFSVVFLETRILSDKPSFHVVVDDRNGKGPYCPLLAGHRAKRLAIGSGIRVKKASDWERNPRKKASDWERNRMGKSNGKNQGDYYG